MPQLSVNFYTSGWNEPTAPTALSDTSLPKGKPIHLAAYSLCRMNTCVEQPSVGFLRVLDLHSQGSRVGAIMFFHHGDDAIMVEDRFKGMLSIHGLFIADIFIAWFLNNFF
jgi:hypothetical protein